VTPDPPDGGETSSAHDAAVAEGASEAHATLADNAASEAREAAAASLEAARAAAEATAAANESADRAENSSLQAGVSLDVINQALVAQGEAISALTAALREGHKTDTAPAATAPSAPAADVKPSKRHWYYGG